MGQIRQPRSRQQRQSLAKLLGSLIPRDGVHATPVDGVELWRASALIPRHPVVYQPGIVIIAQGRKIGYLGDEVYHYDPDNYLVLSVPLPFECETVATPDDPLLGIKVSVDPATLGELLLDLDDVSPPPEQPDTTPRGIYSTPLTHDLTDTTVRLLECLRSPADTRVLGRATARELVYRVLRGPRGAALRALASRDDHFPRIARVLRHLHTDYAQPHTVDDLARRASMSPSVFHHAFKSVTATTPLQYLKNVRLHRARLLMAHAAHNAATAAAAVGYESPSQFGREFKRLFGTTPAEESRRLRGQPSAQPTLVPHLASASTGAPV